MFLLMVEADLLYKRLNQKTPVLVGSNQTVEASFVERRKSCYSHFRCENQTAGERFSRDVRGSVTFPCSWGSCWHGITDADYHGKIQLLCLLRHHPLGLPPLSDWW